MLVYYSHDNNRVFLLVNNVTHRRSPVVSEREENQALAVIVLELYTDFFSYSPLA